jgi:hypothetical protein
VAVPECPTRTSLPSCPDAEALEEPRSAGDDAGHAQPPFLELGLKLVDTAEALPRLCDDLPPEQLAESH